MPFLQLVSIQIATSHLSSLIAESSKMVPTFTENCLRHPAFLHFHKRRVEMYECSFPPHVGQIGPSGQRSLATKSVATSRSEK